MDVSGFEVEDERSESEYQSVKEDVRLSTKQKLAEAKDLMEKQFLECNKVGYTVYRLNPSIFPGSRGPTLRFFSLYDMPKDLNSSLSLVKENSKQDTVFFHIDKALWCNVLRLVLRRAGMKPTKKPLYWNVFWGRRLKDEDYMQLNPYQKIHYFPGTWNIGRKDLLFRNLQRMKRTYGSDDYYFVPQTFLLPGDLTLLTSELKAVEGSGNEGTSHQKKTFIIKPPDSSCGRGIYLVNTVENLPSTNEPCIAQRYIDNPLLINGYKFDLRLYAAVTCFNPLRIYLFEEGLARFATEKYQNASDNNLKHRFMHLTNYSVNVKSKNFGHNVDADADDSGSKWSLSALRKYFLDNHLPWEKVHAGMQDILIKTVVSIESTVTSKVAMFVKYRNSCFELYGYDLIIDSDFNLHLFEVNIIPSLHTTSPLDKKIKHQLVASLFNLIGIQPYNRKQYEDDEEQRRHQRMLGYIPADRTSAENDKTENMKSTGVGTSGNISGEYQLQTGRLPTRNRESRKVIPIMGNNIPVTYGTSSQKVDISLLSRPDFLAYISAEDRAIIRDHVDEGSRTGGFKRIFPTAESQAQYGHLFETPRFHKQLCRLYAPRTLCLYPDPYHRLAKQK